MEINYQISQQNKTLLNDPVFSNWVNINKKVSIKVKSNERSEDSYIGVADFFFRKKS